MQLTKRDLIKTAAIGSAFVGALAVAAPASANSFGPTDSHGVVKVSYNDGADEFCVSGNYHHGSVVYLVPETSGRGPSHKITVSDGETKCVSLATAYEDSRYYYQTGIPLIGGRYSAEYFYS